MWMWILVVLVVALGFAGITMSYRRAPGRTELKPLGIYLWMWSKKELIDKQAQFWVLMAKGSTLIAVCDAVGVRRGNGLALAAGDRRADPAQKARTVGPVSESGRTPADRRPTSGRSGCARYPRADRPFTRNGQPGVAPQRTWRPTAAESTLRSPSQWPGTARSVTSAGRSLIKIMSGIFPDGPAAVERLGDAPHGRYAGIDAGQRGVDRGPAHTRWPPWWNDRAGS
jgi:hypothetical protein